MQPNGRMTGWGLLRQGVAVTLVVAGVGSLVGCQVDVGGQTLPSPHYLKDDVQYFPPGPEFMLSKEAAAIEDYNRTRQVLQPQQ